MHNAVYTPSWYHFLLRRGKAPCGENQSLKVWPPEYQLGYLSIPSKTWVLKGEGSLGRGRGRGRQSTGRPSQEAGHIFTCRLTPAHHAAHTLTHQHAPRF